MTEDERNAWMARCWRCAKYRPKKKTLRCELAVAVKANDRIATDNIGKFADKYGFCKQFDSLE
jgi:hypothetical protein